MIDKRNWNPENIAWAAGLLEGEGSFILRKGQRPEVRCAMTDEDIVVRLHSVLGCGGVYGPFLREGTTHKPQWVFSCQSQHDSLELMVRLRPWMGSRRKVQIEKAIEGWRAYQLTKHSHVKGHQNRASKLSPEQVEQIRSEYNGVRFRHGQQAALAQRFGVSTATIRNAATGVTYA